MTQRVFSQAKNEERRSSSEVNKPRGTTTHVNPLHCSHGNFFPPSSDNVLLFVIGIKRFR